MSTTSDDTATLGAELVMYAARLTRAARRTVDQPGGTRVLSLLDELGPASVTALARADRCAQPTMTGAVAGLVDEGLVRKDPDPADRRVQRVSLTSAGREALADVRRRNGDLVAHRLAGVPRHSPADLATAVAVMRDLLDTPELDTTPGAL